MDYFILLPGDDFTCLENSANILGVESMGNFWPEQGLDVLFSIQEKDPSLLEQILIINDKGKQFTLDMFLNRLSDLKIKNQNK